MEMCQTIHALKAWHCIFACRHMTVLLLSLMAASCDSDLKIHTSSLPLEETPLQASQEEGIFEEKASKFTESDCVDPDLDKVSAEVVFTLCNGESARGRLLVCDSDGSVGCLATDAFKAADMAIATASHIKLGVTIAGVSGAYTDVLPPCTSDGEMGCTVVGPTFKAADTSAALATNIKAGVTIAGMTGLAALESHNNCVLDGEIGCVTTGSYRAVDMSQVNAGNIKNGVTIAGVGGTYPSAATPLSGATATADLTSLVASTAAGSYEFFDSAGARHLGSISDAGTITPGGGDQTFNTSLYRQFTVAGDSDLSAANIKTGVNVFGVAGALAPAPADCSGNAEVGCVTTASFKAADLSNLTAANIKKNVVLAGVTGDYPSATHRLVGADATADLPAFASTSGGTSYEWFISDGTRMTDTIEADETVTATTVDQTLNTGLYRSVTVSGDADLVASNIKTAISVFGVTGNVVPSAGNCSANGEVGCVTTSTYKAADLTNLLSGNIKNGVTVAGTAGTYPSLATPLVGATGTSDLVSMASTAAAGNYEFFDSTGTRYTGSIADAGTVTAGTSSQSFTSSLYRQFTVAGDADLVAENISTGVSIFGVTGAVTPSPADCSADNQTGCVTTATYKSADTGAFLASDLKSGKTVAGVAGALANCASDGEVGCVTTTSYKAANMTNVTAGNIRSGVNIAGQLGDYPSASNPLEGADATADLDLATFDAKIKSASSFEWFSSNGARYTNNGDADIAANNIRSAVVIFGTSGALMVDCQYSDQTSCNADNACYWSAGACSVNSWNIRKGVTISGKAGQLNARCRNAINPSTQDSDSMPPVLATTAGSVNHWWDTIDDYGNPTQVPSSWANTICDRNNWRDETADGTCNSNVDDCKMKDLITNQIWTEMNPSAAAAPGAGLVVDRTWPQAVQYCDSLTYGGRSDWRLPTQKELMTAYSHGLRDMLVQFGAVMADPAGMTDYVWSSTVYSASTSYAWRMAIATGEMTFGSGGYYRSYFCVAE